ncbi:MAG: T9SS type A sorting domain-containing protein, partial [Bacteroidia bacterium]
EVATVNAPANAYTDKSMIIGQAYEIGVVKNSPMKAYGYISAGFKYAPSPVKGGAIVLIDSFFIDSLQSELQRFTEDLELEGWQTKTIYAGRNELVPDVKQRILDTYDENSVALVIIGHVPVPYSGNFTKFAVIPPDGHIEGSGNHTGAWASDAFYADLDGEWTDVSANHKDAKLDRGDNVPGDGKYDQTKIPSDVELQVGRIDFWEMNAFDKTEIELMRNYFERNHNYRIGKWVANDQALIDNNFTAFNLASTGYHNFSTFYTDNKISDTSDYIMAQRRESFTWSYGCGAGSFTTCNGLFNNKRASTTNIAEAPLNNVFTILAGSYFGDWDIANNFLRAPLCNQSLVSFWGGLPRWYVHHMAKGYNIGYGTKLTMNNIADYDNGNFNNSFNSIHIALMGDPTLTMKGLSRPSGLNAITSAGDVELTWTAADGEIDGYNIYRWDTSGVVKKVNDVVITSTSFVDETNWFRGDYTYTVRSVKLAENPSGSYYITSGGPTATVEHVNAVDELMKLSLRTYPNPASETLLIEYGQENEFTVEIYSIGGKLKMTEKVSTENRLLKISQLQTGVYLICCTDTKGNKVISRFVKI